MSKFRSYLEEVKYKNKELEVISEEDGIVSSLIQNLFNLYLLKQGFNMIKGESFKQIFDKIATSKPVRTAAASILKYGKNAANQAALKNAVTETANKNLPRIRKLNEAAKAAKLANKPQKIKNVKQTKTNKLSKKATQRITALKNAKTPTSTPGVMNKAKTFLQSVKSIDKGKILQGVKNIDKTKLLKYGKNIISNPATTKVGKFIAGQGLKRAALAFAGGPVGLTIGAGLVGYDLIQAYKNRDEIASGIASGIKTIGSKLGFVADYEKMFNNINNSLDTPLPEFKKDPVIEALKQIIGNSNDTEVNKGLSNLKFRLGYSSMSSDDKKTIDGFIQILKDKNVRTDKTKLEKAFDNEAKPNQQSNDDDD
jgi:hypothetical protein